MERAFKIAGVLSLVFGCLAALLCLFPFGIFLAIIAGFLGMLCSMAYIFLDNRYQLSDKRLTLGIIGIVLSSIPILLIVIFNIIHSFKH